MTKFGWLALYLCLVNVAGCLEPEDPFNLSSEDLEKEEVPVNDVALPTLIGYKMVQTVMENDKQDTTIDPGQTITYQFIDESTIRGEGIATIPTIRWEYTKVGPNEGRATLVYEPGTSIEKLYFDPDDKTRGDYTSEITFNSGQKNKHWGRFEIMALATTGQTNEDCLNENGTLSLWTSAPASFPMHVYIDGVWRTDLIQQAATAPVCGVLSSGAVATLTMTPGNYNVSAADSATGTWSATAITITACGCVTHEFGP